MTAMLGKIDEFDSEREDWSQYVERLSFFFDANGISETEKKRAVLLSVIGAPTYKLLSDLLSPDKPGDKSYTDLVKVLTDHFNPTPSEIVERFKFHSRFRRQGESVATYVSELRSLAKFCNFGASLEEMLRDRIVCGINDDALQKRLLSEPGLTFQKALELAQGFEMATRNVRELQSGKHRREPDGQTPISPAVHKVTPRGGKPQTIPKKFDTQCYRCGRVGHLASKCRFKDCKCHKCGKVGHLQKVCRSQKKSDVSKQQQPTVHQVQDSKEEAGQDSESLLCHLHSPGYVPPLRVMVELGGQPLQMEVDTGAAISLVSKATFETLLPGRALRAVDMKLRSYAGELIPVVGSIDIDVKYKEQTAKLPLLVVRGDGPSLFGRNWLNCIRLNWHEIHHLQDSRLSSLLEKYKLVFSEGLGTLRGFEATISVDASARPRYCKARPVPYALREKVEEELNRLVDEGTLEPVQFASWATPIVVVLKKDRSSVRICGDFKQTVNPVSKLDHYPIPRIEDLFASLSKGRFYSKIDLSHAYQQLPLDNKSKDYVIINTHKGLFRYTRLPFGIASAPGIFQRAIENILQGIPGVVAYLDDILISGDSEASHLKALEEVLRRLEEVGLRAKREKCQFMLSSVPYLGYQIDERGLHPLPEKVKAIVEAPSPRNTQELKSYLGLLTYYCKFLPNLSTRLAPLYKLLRKGQPWHWRSKQKRAFKESKKLLTSAEFLVHFDPKLKLVLACDASAYGIGAVLAHRFPDGSERPIGYASRTLTQAERNYSQIEREGLACIFGVKRFHSYLFGHHFELITDHKPLLALMGEHRATPTQASARIRRWSLFLSTYEYTLSFRKTEAHGNADALSRLPLPTVPPATETPPELVLLMEHLKDSPITAHHIRSMTSRDVKLSTVLQFIQQGWPDCCPDPTLAPFASRKAELSVLGGCILWGSRVIIPEQGRDAVLQELHEGHTGMNRMKSLARMYVWWPKIDSDIEKLVRTCSACQLTQTSPPVAPLHPWKWPTRPWCRVHLDYAGPFLGHMFLILIDSHSKWIEAIPTSSSTSHTTAEELRTIFAKFGLPETVVTDNGPCFVSIEFEEFLRNNGVRHITVHPYHPASNGLAERAVQIVKKGLKKEQSGSIKSRLAKVLFAYRLTPHSTTGESPAELLLGRRPRTKLDLLKPNTAERVEKRQWEQKLTHDTHARYRSFKNGDLVFVRNFREGERWIPGKIVQCLGDVSYSVQLDNGHVSKRHQDHLRHRYVELRDSLVTSEIADTFESSIPCSTSPPQAEMPATGNNTETLPEEVTESRDSSTVSTNGHPNNDSPPGINSSSRSYPQRNRKPPNRYEPLFN